MVIQIKKNMMKIEKLKKKAIAGNKKAQEKLAFCYDIGKGTRKSYKKAFYWYMEASTNCNPVVEYNIGLFYLLGQGTEKSDQEAFLWTQKSARQGYPDGMLALGWHYHNGVGIKKDLNLARKYYKKCLDTECACSAYFSLGEIAYSNTEYYVAFKFFSQSAKNAHVQSIYYLGRMYFEGKGVSKDVRKAKDCLTIAQKGGIYNATKLLRSKKFIVAQKNQSCRGRGTVGEHRVPDEEK